MTTQRYQAVTKILVSAAIVVGSYVGGAAPASADPNPPSPSLNPFSALSCSWCRETALAGSPALKAEIDRGIQEGLSAWLPGLPSPTH